MSEDIFLRSKGESHTNDFMKEKLNLGHFPTPIEHMEYGKKYNVELFVKRDDLDEFIGSGNKARKLEYLLYDAQRLSCDIVLSAGGMQSNHCRATAYFSKKLGINVELFLFGEEKAQGNLLIDKLLGAKIHPITHEEYENVVQIMNKKKDELESIGHKVYVIPPGGSNAVGFLGYASAVQEISDWEKKHTNFDYVVSATGTAGTIAGLEIGKNMYDEKFKVIGINVTKRSSDDFNRKMSEELQKFNARYKTNIKEISPMVIDGYVGEDYAVPSSEDFEFIKKVALKEQIILDPVYTAKAFKGMISMVEKGEIKSGSRILFVHTGGTFGLFAFADKMKEFLR